MTRMVITEGPIKFEPFKVPKQRKSKSTTKSKSTKSSGKKK